MTSLIHWLYPGDGVTCLVVNAIVQIAVAVVVAALVSGTLLRRWPAAQHAVWLACLGFTLVCPLTALASKRSGLFSFSLAPATESAAANSRPADRGDPSPAADTAPKAVHEPRIGLADVEPRELPDRPGPHGEPAVAQPVAAAEPKPETAPSKVAQANRLAKPFDFRALVAAAIGIWAAGVLFLAARLLHGILAVGTLRRTSAPLDPSALGDVLADVRRSLGLARLPPIGLSERIATPVVAGLFRPAVLLPASLPAAIGQGRIRDILLHECAHVARRDPWVVVLQRLVALAYWPHPCIHFLNRQLARCREEVCDNWVLRAVRPADYADTLLEVAIHCRDRFGVDMPIGLFDVHGKVEDRVRRLLDRRRDSGVQLPARARWSVLAAAAILLAVAASFPLVAPAQADKQRTAAKVTAEKQPPAQKESPAKQPAPLNSEQPTAGKSEADKKTKYIEGITVDSEGKPLADVQVHSGFGDYEEIAVSGPDGRFRLPNENNVLGPSLLAESQDHKLIGFSDFLTRNMSRAAPQTGQLKFFRIVLKPARNVRVKVATSDGKPAAGVTLQVIGRTLHLPDFQTDDEGEAALCLPRDADVQWIVARKDDLGLDYYENYRNSPFEQPSPLPARVELRLHKPSRVHIRTIDLAGKPVAGLGVMPQYVRLPGKRNSLEIWRFPGVSQSSDASGECDFDWLPADAAEPISFRWLTNGEYTCYDKPQWDPAQPQVPVTFHLLRTPRVSGTVRFPDGKPAAGVRVLTTYLGNTFGKQTDANGHYRTYVEPRKPNIVAISDRDWAAASHTGVRLEDGQTRDHLDFVLSRGTRIHGRITRGAGHGGAGHGQVYLVELGERQVANAGKSDQEEGPLLFANIDAKGNYEFRVGPGRYSLRMPGSTADAGRIEVKVTDQPELVYDDIAVWPRKMRINGRVVRAADGKAVAGAIVYGDSVGLLGSQEVRADAQGQFSTLRAADAEKWALYARAPEPDLAGVAVVASSASEATIKLRPAATVIGFVYNSQGKPVAGEKVTAAFYAGSETSTGFGNHHVDAVSDQSGRYRVPCLALGSRCVIVILGVRTSIAHIDVKPDRPGEISVHDIVLPADGPAPPPGAGQLHTVPPPPTAASETPRPHGASFGSKTKTLKGVVAAPDGAPLSDVYVRWCYYNAEGASDWQQTETDKAGRFRATVPARCEAMLWILPEKYAPMRTTVESNQADVGVLKVQKGEVLRGAILDADGKPVVGQLLVVRTARDRTLLANGGAILDRYAHSGAAGKVTFDPLPPGDYVVAPSDEDPPPLGPINPIAPIQRVYYSAKVKIGADGAKPFELKAVRTVKIVANVYANDGKKITGSLIWCAGRNPGGVDEAWNTGGIARDGRCEMLAPRGMENANLMFMPDEKSSFRFRKSADALLQAGRELKLGTLTGDLTDIRVIRYVAPVLLVKAADRTGKPIARAEVSARYDDASLNESLSFERQKDGRHRSPSLLPDEKLTVTVTADGYLPQSRNLSLAEGTTSQLDLVLSPR